MNSRNGEVWRISWRRRRRRRRRRNLIERWIWSGVGRRF